MEIYTQFKRPENRKFTEPWSSKTMTETQGHITSKTRIENMMRAGQQLQTAREDFYDFKEGQEIDEYADMPTRDPGFDLADAAQARLQLQQKAHEQDSEQRRQTLANNQVLVNGGEDKSDISAPEGASNFKQSGAPLDEKNTSE